jgi:membrane fusion protein (multidrug efflux system)
MKEGELSVSVILSDGSEHPHNGKVDFINNVVDSTTGTITLRAVVPNPEKELLPGQYTRVRLLVDMKSDALLVPEQAVGEDQGGSYTLVVGKDDKVEARDVKALWTYKGMRVIEEGVKKGERVIIEGLQKVRPGMAVTPKLADSQEESKKVSEDHKHRQGAAS